MHPPSTSYGAPGSELVDYGSTGSPLGQSPPGGMPPGGLQPMKGMSLQGLKGMKGLKDNFDALREKIRFDDLPALLVPWLLFATVLLPTALVEQSFLSYLAVTLCAVLTLGFMLLSKSRGWQLLAFTCFASTVLGVFMGHYDRDKYLMKHIIYQRSPTHTDVIPTTGPGAYRDAGYLTFSDDAHVDTTMGLGYRSGQLWCVAPVTQGYYVTLPAEANFWAVGQDCCKERGFFDCGPVDQDRPNLGGLVVMDLGQWKDETVEMYEKAAYAAAETYGLTMPSKPIFVRWGTDAEQVLTETYSDAQAFVFWALGLFAVIVPLFAAAYSVLGLALTGRPEGHGWYPDMVKEMAFGLNLSQKEYSPQVRLDLLNNRHHWTGEVIFDYAFHVANNHTFLGCLCAHPAHPFSKYERFIVLCAVVPLIAFPVAAVSAAGESDLVRILFIMFIATIPSIVLKRLLTQISQEDHRLELESGRKQSKPRLQEILQWELTVCGVALLLALVLSVFSVKVVQEHVEGSVGDFVWRNACEAIGFAFILELLLGVLAPNLGGGPPHVGFFGRWRLERDHLEDSRSLPPVGPDEVGFPQ